MSKTTIKYILFSLILAVLLFPLCFQASKGTITKPLKGYQAPPEKVDFSTANWWAGNWQEYIELYAKDQLQARHFLIRLNNQLKFSLFNQVNANGIERGKNDFYFEYRYISAYLGRNYQGEEHYQEKVAKLQELSDTLQAHGVETLFVIASGKANFMPEHLPKKYDKVQKLRNNYEAFIEQMNASSVPYLDLNQYLLDMKDTASYPLYTKGNVHWSFYAISFVTDTLIATIEKQLDQSLPAYSRTPVSLAYEPTYYTEGGIFNSLNLYWTELRDTFAYRDVIEEKSINENKYRPKIWAIGDSFYGTLHTYKVPHQFFDHQSLFFYYNHSIVDQENKNYEAGTITSYLDQIEEQDMILFFTTDAGIPGCGWGAEDAILNFYKNK